MQVSGVLGIVACGVMMSYYGKPRVSSPVLPSLMDFWKTLQFFADTVIFFLSGKLATELYYILLYPPLPYLTLPLSAIDV